MSNDAPLEGRCRPSSQLVAAQLSDCRLAKLPWTMLDAAASGWGIEMELPSPPVDIGGDKRRCFPMASSSLKIVEWPSSTLWDSRPGSRVVVLISDKQQRKRKKKVSMKQWRLLGALLLGVLMAGT